MLSYQLCTTLGMFLCCLIHLAVPNLPSLLLNQLDEEKIAWFHVLNMSFKVRMNLMKLEACLFTRSFFFPAHQSCCVSSLVVSQLKSSQLSEMNLEDAHISAAALSQRGKYICPPFLLPDLDSAVTWLPPPQSDFIFIFWRLVLISSRREREEGFN